MSTDRPGPPIRRFRVLARPWVIVPAVGIVAFLGAQLAVSRAGDAAEVVMILDRNEVVWPYHDAVRQEALGLLRDDPEAAELLADLAGPEATLDGRLLSGQSHFAFTVGATDVERASDAADGLAEWLMDRSTAGLLVPIDAELSVLAQRRLATGDELTRLEPELGAAGPAAVLASARFGELASLLAQYERRTTELETRRELVRPQLRPAAAARPVGRPLEPLASGIAGVVAAGAALAFLQTSNRHPEADA